MSNNRNILAPPPNTPSAPSIIGADSVEELTKQLNQVEPPKYNQKAKDILDVAISKLITFSPVFGVVFMFLNKRQDRSLPTMGVGVIDRVNLALFYNPEFVEKLTDKELRAVLQHEALHVLLHHLIRREHFDYQPIGFNVAADMAINCHLSNLPAGGFYPKTFNLEDFQASEWYYEQLRDQAEKNGSGQGGIPFYVEGKGNMVGDHDRWGECEDEVIKEKVRNIADAAVKEQAKKGWSSFGSQLCEAILAANKPVVNWKKQLRYFIQQLVLSGRRTTRTRINRREQAIIRRRKVEHPDDIFNSIYLQPGTKRDFRSKLLIGIDTSGSMSDEEIEMCLSEISGMVDHVDCYLMWFDTQLFPPPIHIENRIKSIKIQGRGGTDFNPIMRYVEENYFDGVIVLTDGCCGFPEKPKKTRVMWGLTPQGASVYPPYGRRVVIEPKRK